MVAAGVPGGFPPATVAAVLEILVREHVPLQGRRAVVIGRSNIVGKPAALLLLAEHATVTICHSRTRNLPEVCQEADILVVAAGRPKMIGAITWRRVPSSSMLASTRWTAAVWSVTLTPKASSASPPRSPLSPAVSGP